MHAPAVKSDRLPRLEVLIEIPRGSFVKRDGGGRVDFISPFPCPFNYGSVPRYIGGEGDYLDAIVLGPRLAQGACVTVTAYGAVGLSERHQYDDKVVCAHRAVTEQQKRHILRFFHFYAFCKGWLNVLRCQSGRTQCEGWDTAQAAVARAVPVPVQTI
ncbi:MAG: inorganic diphosphatase [Halioglobus sp.]|nr:inorganic diphosphatase [Halioglobus sp.]